VQHDLRLSQLAVLTEQMDDIRSCMQNMQERSLLTEQRVDGIETQVKELELMPPSHKSSNCL